MKFSEKEITYIEKAFSEKTEPNVEFIVEILNKRRSEDEKATVEDILEAAGSLLDVGADIAEGSSPQDNTRRKETASADDTQLKKRLGSLKRDLDVDTETELFTQRFFRAILESSEWLEMIATPEPQEYRIVSGKTQAYLAQEVNKYIKMGWVPFGSVGAAAFGVSPVAGNQYIQAMVIYKHGRLKALFDRA